jgi:hypothetical protein
MHSHSLSQRSSLLGSTRQPSHTLGVTKRIRTYNHLAGGRHGAFASKPARSSPGRLTAPADRAGIGRISSAFSYRIVTLRISTAAGHTGLVTNVADPVGIPAYGTYRSPVACRHPGLPASGGRRGHTGQAPANQPAITMIRSRLAPHWDDAEPGAAGGGAPTRSSLRQVLDAAEDVVADCGGHLLLISVFQRLDQRVVLPDRFLVRPPGLRAVRERPP